MRTIWSLWQDALAEERTKPAYLVEENGGWREVSQAEAAEAVDELAHGLFALGIKKGDSFGILARTRLEWVLLDFALAQIGAVPAPIYPSSTPTECCYILEHSNAVGCFVEDDELLAKIEAARPEHVYTIETLPELRALGREHAAANPDALEQAREQIGDDDLYTFIYTSGTTGPPKACMILNRNYYDMVGRIDEIADFFLKTDVMLLYLPLAHNFGRLMHLLGAHLGYTVRVPARPAADRRRHAAGPADRAADGAPRAREGAHGGLGELRSRHRRQAAAHRLGARGRRGGQRHSAEAGARAGRPRLQASPRRPARLLEGQGPPRRTAPRRDLRRSAAREGDRRAGEVLEIDPPRRLVLSWENQFQPELKAEGPSRAIFTLEPDGDMMTGLTVEHAIDKPDSNFIEAVSGGWPLILASLKSLLETGESLEATRKWPEGM